MKQVSNANEGVYFRPQRGGLADSMAERQVVHSRADLVEIAKAHVVDLTVIDLDIIHQGVDRRIGWDSHLVSVPGWGPIGYLSGPLPASGEAPSKKV